MMKRGALAAVLLVSISGNAQKQRFTEPTASSYPLKLHVSHSYVLQGGGVAYLHLVGILDGAKVELAGGLPGTTVLNTPLLPPGDYAVRLVGVDTKKDGSRIQDYDLLLANGQHESFTVVGLSE